MGEEGGVAAGLFDIRPKDYEYLQEQARVTVYATSENPLLWMLGRSEEIGDGLDAEDPSNGKGAQAGAQDGEEIDGIQGAPEDGEADDLDGMANDEFDADGVIEVDAPSSTPAKKTPKSAEHDQKTQSKPKEVASKASDAQSMKKKKLADDNEAEEQEMMNSKLE